MRFYAAVVLSLTAWSAAAIEQDAAAILSGARAAMGGDAVLNAVTSLTVTGSETQDIGPVRAGRSLEIHYQKPDKFVRTTRQTFNDPFGGGFTITTRRGFNGNALIAEIIAPGAPMPGVIPAPDPRTAQQHQAREERALRDERREFARLLLPLFAASTDTYRTQFRYEGRQTVDGRAADVIVITHADGFEARLFIDATAHLPVRLTWMAQPVVVFSGSSRVLNPRTYVASRMPEDPVAPPPPGPQADVEWSTTIDDYKSENGLTWPRRFRTSVGGKRYEDVQLGKYKINPAIKPSTFDFR